MKSHTHADRQMPDNMSRFMEKLLDGVEVEWKKLGDVAE